MKKLSILFLLLTAFIFVGCSDDDKAQLVTSFEKKLTEANSEFKAVEEIPSLGTTYSTTFQDNSKTITFEHSYADWGSGYTFSQFTYTNKTDNSTVNSITSITKKGKVGTTYLSAFTSDWTPAEFTINSPQIYNLKGAWVTNSTYAYNAMTTDKISGTTPFKKGDWFKLEAIGYSSNNIETGTAEIYLANYTSDNDKPVNEWIWFDMSELGDAVKVKFQLSSTDNGKYGMNTPSYFCMDGITLEEKKVLPNK